MVSCLSLAVLALLVAAPAGAQSAASSNDASGKWNLTFNTTQGTEAATLTLKKDGDKLAGLISGPRGEMEVSGVQKNAEVTIGFSLQTANGPIDISLNATQNGHSMSGAALAGGQQVGDFTGTRDTAPAGPATEASAKDAAAKTDVTGTWLFDVSSPAGTGTRTVTFKQDGEKITGKYTGQYGDSDLTGTVKGADISFYFDVNAEGTSVRVTYTGKVDTDTMKGTLSLGDLGDGTFTAKRK
jgi:hypothetical protein